MSEFYVYDGAARVGILEHWSSVQWLEQYASGGEAKIVAMATPQNVALLAVGRALYNPETGTAAHILSQQIDDKGASPTITLRGAVGAARLDQRVVMGTVAVKDAETGMRAMVSQNLRGLPIQLAAPAGTGVTLDTQVSWGSVLEGLETLASASGLGFGCTFDPAAGTEAFAVYAGQDRTQGEGYNGYLGDDISNITDLKLVRGVSDHANVA
ncbi:MAG: siphovirus ReqiPepy6 Gp37-like family protein, partial [Bacteroidales bacterium]|nr:siphovirus ReqiPepy6 Gp37-like family protein [Bacteroidales bacterium]